MLNWHKAIEMSPCKFTYVSAQDNSPSRSGSTSTGFCKTLPTTAFAMVAATGDIYYGLWYPIVVAGATVVLGMFLLPETFKKTVDA